MLAHETFGRWLKQARKAKGLTQAALADRIGYAVITLRKIEADALRPSQDLLRRLLEEFKLEEADQRILITLARSNLPGHTHSLPTPMTTLFGRATEATDICTMLRGPVRLLTLTGPGGIGKTRLAITVAIALLGDFSNGVFFINLAAIRDPAMVLPTIARVINVQERANASLIDVIAHTIQDQQILLVLDNYEQIVTSAPQLAVLLKAVRGLKILVTSRATLHVSGEHVFAVPPLMLPPARSHGLSDDALIKQATQFPAVALFVERAHAAAPAFALNAANLASIVAICTQLDGLPLAIELTAAACRLFTPQELLTRLEQRLDLPANSVPTLPTRQQTLRATIDWSYQLLGPAEQMLLRRLAVFNGGWTLEAAETIVAMVLDTSDLFQHGHMQPAPSSFIPLSSILKGIEVLLDHSLVLYQDQIDGTRRFSMLETIREFALEQLLESGELDAVRASQSAYYLALVTSVGRHLTGGDQAPWLERIGADLHNLRAVIAWNLAPVGDPLIALQLAEALAPFWWIRNYFSEGRMWLTAALAAAPRPRTILHGRALNIMGILARFQNDMQQARTLIEQSLTLFRALEARGDIGNALINLGILALDQGNYVLAQAYCSEGLVITQEAGDLTLSGWALVTLGNVAVWGRNYPQATQLYKEGSALFRAASYQRGVARTLTYEASCLKEQYEYAQATEHAETSLALFRTLGDTYGTAMALHALGEIAQAQGQHTQALALLDESLQMVRELDGQRRMGWVLITKGQALEMAGDVAAAGVCYEESRQSFEQISHVAGQALSIFWLGRNAHLEGNHHTAYHLLDRYVAFAHDLEMPRMVAEGICLRDSILAAMEWGQGVAQLEEDLVRFRAAGDQWGTCIALRVLGMACVGTANDRARTSFHEGLARAYDLNDRIGVLIQLAGLASLFLSHGRRHDAARLCGAVETLEADLGVGYVVSSMWPPDHARWSQTRDDVRAAFDDSALANAWADGQFASLNEIIEFARHSVGAYPIHP